MLNARPAAGDLKKDYFIKYLMAVVADLRASKLDVKKVEIEFQYRINAVKAAPEAIASQLSRLFNGAPYQYGDLICIDTKHNKILVDAYHKIIAKGVLIEEVGKLFLLADLKIAIPFNEKNLEKVELLLHATDKENIKLFLMQCIHIACTELLDKDNKGKIKQALVDLAEIDAISKVRIKYLRKQFLIKEYQEKHKIQDKSAPLPARIDEELSRQADEPLHQKLMEANIIEDVEKEIIINIITSHIVQLTLINTHIMWVQWLQSEEGKKAYNGDSSGITGFLTRYLQLMTDKKVFTDLIKEQINAFLNYEFFIRSIPERSAEELSKLTPEKIYDIACADLKKLSDGQLDAYLATLESNDLQDKMFGSTLTKEKISFWLRVMGDLIRDHKDIERANAIDQALRHAIGLDKLLEEYNKLKAEVAKPKSIKQQVYSIFYTDPNQALLNKFPMGIMVKYADLADQLKKLEQEYAEQPIAEDPPAPAAPKAVAPVALPAASAADEKHVEVDVKAAPNPEPYNHIEIILLISKNQVLIRQLIDTAVKKLALNAKEREALDNIKTLEFNNEKMRMPTYMLLTYLLENNIPTGGELMKFMEKCVEFAKLDFEQARKAVPVKAAAAVNGMFQVYQYKRVPKDGIVITEHMHFKRSGSKASADPTAPSLAALALTPKRSRK